MNKFNYYCVQCRKTLDKDNLYCDDCKLSFEDRFFKCRECGCAVIIGDDFCSHCLTVYPKGAGEPQPPNDAGQKIDPPAELPQQLMPPKEVLADIPPYLDMSRPPEVWDVMNAPAYRNTKNKRKGRGKKMVLIALLIVLLIGAAAVFAYFNREVIAQLLSYMDYCDKHNL